MAMPASVAEAQSPPGARALQAGWAILLLIMLVAVVPFFLDSGPETTVSTGSGDFLRQGLYLATLAYVLISQGVLRNPGKLRILPLSLTLLMAWCVLSVIWAIDPGISLRRATLTIIVILTVFLVVDAAGTARTLLLLRWSLAAILLLNYLVVFASPEGVHTAAGFDPSLAGNWRGLMLHKNTAGVACAFTILLWLFTGDRGPVRWLIIVAAACFLYQTQSKTSLGALGVSLIFGLIFAVLSARPRIIAALIAVTTVILLLLVGQEYLGEEISRYLSQPDAVTGRAQIWKIVWSYAMSNLALGSGYGSFWDIGAASPIYRYTRGWVVFITSGHNGYLDVLAQLGLGGLVLTVAAVVVLPFWKLLRNGTSAPGVLGLLAAGVAFCAIHNVTETSFLDRDRLVWVFLLFLVALIGVEDRRRSRLAARRRAT
jgi:O-antigen ligase